MTEEKNKEIKKPTAKELLGREEGPGFFHAEKEKETIKEKEKTLEEKFAEEEIMKEIEMMNTDESLRTQAEAKAQKIQFLDEDDKINNLLKLAKQKGIAFAIATAQKMNDPYILDILHDVLAREGLYKNFIK